MSGFNPGNGTLRATNKPAAFIELAQLLAAEEQLMSDQTGTKRVQMMVDVQAQAIVILARLPFQTSPIGNGLSLVPVDYLNPTPTPTPIPGVPLTYQSVGDAKGIFYYIGTLYGTSQQVFGAPWYNPQTPPISVVKAVWSSIEYGYIENLTDREASGLLFSDNAPGQWLAFDFGAGNTLSPNYYTLRHHSRSDGDYLRSFKLQGSNNVASNSVADLASATWTDLDGRVGDTQINGSDAWGGWAVTGVTTPYRWLRILQTAANARGRHYLVCGEVEFYGTFRR